MEHDPNSVVENIGGLTEASTSKSTGSVTFLIDDSLHGVIPEPYPSSDNIPDWYKNMPLHRENSNTGSKVEKYTVKGCRPFMQGLTAGWLLPLPADIHILHDENGLRLDFSEFDENDYLSPMNQDPGIGEVSDGVYKDGTVIKINTPWYISVPDGYSILEIPTLNRQNNIFNKYFSPFGGIWDADVHIGKINPFALMNVEPGTDVVVPAGTPISQLIPIKRSSMMSDASIQCLNKSQKEKISKYNKLSDTTFHLYADYIWNPIKASRMVPSSNENNSGCPFTDK